MTVRKRALGVLAAGALFLPLLPLSSAAYAAPGDQDPPPRQNIEEFCEGVPESPNPFVDIAGNTFEREIECAAAAELTRGGPEGRPRNQYGPFLNVRRDQMASFIARLIDTANELDCDDSLQDLPGGDGVVPFTDVLRSNPHFSAIDRLEEEGIVLGAPFPRPRNEYGPADSVNRDQMASFINRAIGFLNDDDGFQTSDDFFVDDESSIHEPNINGIASQGIVVGGPRGQSQDNYGPLLNVRRDEMSAFLTRTLANEFDRGNIRALNGQCEQDPDPVVDGEATVQIDDTTVMAGDPITGTVTGDQPIESVRITGDCIADITLTQDGNPNRDGFQFSVDTLADAAEGDCVLTFTTTFENGTTDVDRRTVTIVGDPGDTTAPTIDDARVATDAAMATDGGNATGTASAGDVFELTFSEDIATDSSGGQFSVEDDDGDTATFVCDADVVGGDGITAVRCEIDGNVLTVTLLEDAEDTNAAGNGVLDFPLLITEISGFFDAAGNEATVEGSAVIDRDGDTNDTGDTVAPTIDDARVATDSAMGTGSATATDTASTGDVFELTFSEDITESAGQFDVVDEGGDTARFVCDADVVANDDITAVRCVIDGNLLTVTLLEDADDTNTAGNGVLDFPLTITEISGFSDFAGNEATVEGSADPEINRTTDTNDTGTP
jgi:hypothetical protein